MVGSHARTVLLVCVGGRLCFWKCCWVFVWFVPVSPAQLTTHPTREATCLLIPHAGQALKYYWKAVFGVFYPLEFAFLSIAKLTVLDRLFAFAVPAVTAAHRTELYKKLLRVQQAIMFIAIVGSVVGFFGNVASAAYCVQIGRDTAELLQQYMANTSMPWRESPSSKKVVDLLKLNATALSIQLFCELVVLVAVVAVFIVFGTICLSRIYAARSQLLSSSDRTHTQLHKIARTLKFKIIATVLAITVAFSLRSVFAIMYVC